MNQRLLTLLALCLLSVVTPIVADDYVDDAYYWDGTTCSTAKHSPKKADTTSYSKTKAATTEQKTTRIQSTNRPVTPKVEILQEQDTVVKAIIHRNK